jgi:lysine 2,3-aminomutase
MQEQHFSMTLPSQVPTNKGHLHREHHESLNQEQQTSASNLENAAIQNDFSPPEFVKLKSDLNSVVSSGSRLFHVSPEQFVNWRWQMGKQLRDTKTTELHVRLTGEERSGFEKLDQIFHAGVTPYYSSLIHQDNPHCPIRLQSIPRLEELSDFVGVADPLLEKEHSPVREVVHVYPDRVAFCVAQLCPVYCRYCYRKRRDSEHGLHFNRSIIERGIAYIASNPAIRDVLITGGDPFIASDEAIDDLLQRLRAINHVEIIRFGTRTPVTLPYRVTKKLAKIIAQYHPVYVNTHFNCVEEINVDSAIAIDNLLSEGIIVGNQTVLLKGVNDTYDKMFALLRGLLKIRVRPYYIFHPHNVEGTLHLRPSVRTGLDIVKRLRGQLTGFGIPTYIVDTPSGKVPIGHNHILGVDGQDLILEDTRGEIWREKGVYW